MSDDQPTTDNNVLDTPANVPTMASTTGATGLAPVSLTNLTATTPSEGITQIGA